MSVWDVIAEHATLANGFEDRPEDERGIIISALELASPNANQLADDMVYAGPGEFERTDRPLALAIHEISLNGFADAEGGTVQYGLHGSRVGRFVLWFDDAGFAQLERFENEQLAQDALDAEDRRCYPPEEE